MPQILIHEYIGQVLRLYYVEGLPREIQEDHLGPELSQHCRTLWWTVYILGRRMSSLIGAPNSIRDEDITINLPSVKNPSTAGAASTLIIKLSQLSAQMTTSKPPQTLFSNQVIGLLITHPSCL